MSVLSKMLLGEISKEELNSFAEKEVFSELPYLALHKKFKNQQEYLDKTPEFCKFLYEEANERKLGIKKYIAQLTRNKKIVNQSQITGIEITFVNPGDVLKEKEQSNNSLQDSILNTSLDELRDAAEWLSDEYTKIFKILAKFENFMDLLSIEKESSTPNLDDLDKLMRYQTTLQRQLSTITGELLALTK